MLKARYFIFLIILTVFAFVAGATLTNKPGEETAAPPQALPSPSEDAGEVASETVEAATAATLPQIVNDPSNVDVGAAAQEEQLAQEPVDDIEAADSKSSSEQGEALLSDPAQKDGTLPAADAHLPLMVRWSNWQTDYGPAIVYAREWDLDGMLRVQGPVDKMLMVTSYDEAERLLTRADELSAAGVTIIGLNTENGPEITPHAEMDTLDSADPNINVVARVAQLAGQNGFDVIWGPVRNNADAVSDAAIRTMMDAGVRGIALQEQKFIEVQPAQLRLAEVNRTRERYLRLAQEQAVDDFTIHVQIMPQRCPDLSNCVAFVLGLEDIPVDSIAIWSNGPIPLSFLTAIRHY